MALIELASVSFKYPGAQMPSLDGVSLNIPEGAFFALLGPNGAGKTTLLRLLCGRFPEYEGSLNIDSRFCGEGGFLPPESYGILLENPGAYGKLSIAEYLEYFGKFYGMTFAAIQERVSELGRRLSVDKLDARMGSLSLGTRQKVQLIRALLHSPGILILDEPVANMDPEARSEVWKLISEWRRDNGGTAIVCSHILAEMETEATHYAIMNKGRILKCGPVDGLASSKNKMSVAFDGPVDMARVSEALKSAGLNPAAIRAESGSLQDLYREIIR